MGGVVHEDRGLYIVSAILRDPRMYQDTTRRGGLASLMGMEIWCLVKILLPVLRMVLTTSGMVVGCVAGQSVLRLGASHGGVLTRGPAL